jgi:hypothetical protein
MLPHAAGPTSPDPAPLGDIEQPSVLTRGKSFSVVGTSCSMRLD